MNAHSLFIFYINITIYVPFRFYCGRNLYDSLLSVEFHTMIVFLHIDDTLECSVDPIYHLE